MPSSPKNDVTLAVLGFQDIHEPSLLFSCAQLSPALVIRSLRRHACVRGNSDTASHCSCCIPSPHPPTSMHSYANRPNLVDSECESGTVLIDLKGCYRLNTNLCTQIQLFKSGEVALGEVTHACPTDLVAT